MIWWRAADNSGKLQATTHQKHLWTTGGDGILKRNEQIMTEWTDEYIKEVQSKGVWTLVPAIYGPEGCEYNEIDNKEWYDKLSKKVDDEGDSSIYGRGLVLGLVCQFDRPIVVGEIRGQEKSLKYFHDLLAEVKLKTVVLKELVEYCDDGSAAFDDPHPDSIFIKVIDAFEGTKETEK